MTQVLSLRKAESFGQTLKAGQMDMHRDHLVEAHSLWHKLVRAGDCVVDATLGKGRDAVILASLCLANELGSFWGIDLQQQAVDTSRVLLQGSLPEEFWPRLHLCCMNHENFPEELLKESVRLIVYNLGYLPGGDQTIITCTQSTIKSLNQALTLLTPGGVISCTCYSGHPGGDQEEDAVIAWASQLPRHAWTVRHTRWLNRRHGPSLLLIQRTAS